MRLEGRNEAEALGYLLPVSQLVKTWYQEVLLQQLLETPSFQELLLPLKYLYLFSTESLTHILSSPCRNMGSSRAGEKHLGLVLWTTGSDHWVWLGSSE